MRKVGLVDLRMQHVGMVSSNPQVVATGFAVQYVGHCTAYWQAWTHPHAGMHCSMQLSVTSSTTTASRQRLCTMLEQTRLPYAPNCPYTLQRQETRSELQQPQARTPEHQPRWHTSTQQSACTSVPDHSHAPKPKKHTQQHPQWIHGLRHHLWSYFTT